MAIQSKQETTDLHTLLEIALFSLENLTYFMGDVNLTGLPYIDAGNGGTVDGMIYSIKKFQMTDENTVVVPGHGEISEEDLEIYLAKIELVRNRVFIMTKEGDEFTEILQADQPQVFPSNPLMQVSVFLLHILLLTERMLR